VSVEGISPWRVPGVTMNADPELAPLNEIFEDVSFNFCVQMNTCPTSRGTYAR
jgi:hypothetical protein